MTHFTLQDLMARGACSRLEPQPKLGPATIMSPGWTEDANPASMSSIQWEAKAAGLGSFKCRAGMITSVSTLAPYLYTFIGVVPFCSKSKESVVVRS